VSNRYRLPVRPSPIAGESTLGYLIRLSSDNGYVFPSWLRSLEPDLARVSEKFEYFEALERLTGLTSFEQVLDPPKGPGKLLERFRTIQPRVCPLCVKEGYCDAIWDVIYSCVCPYHGVYLIDSCLQCSKKLNWNRGHVGQCSCGADLAEGNHIEAGLALRYLNAKLWAATGKDIEVIADGFPDEALAKLSLEDLCTCYRFMSSFANGQLRQNHTRPGNVQDSIRELEVASAVLSEWPNGMYELLNRRKDQDGKFALTGIYKAFGKLYHDLYNQQAKYSGEQFSFIREAFEEFVNVNWIGNVDKKSKSLFDNLTNKSVPLTRIKKELNIGHNNLKYFVKEGILEASTKVFENGRQHTVLTPIEISALKEKLSTRINQQETCNILGVSKLQFRALFERGLLKPVVVPQKIGPKIWWCNSEDVDQLLVRIFSVVKSQDPAPGSISFTRVCQAYLPRHLMPDLLLAIESGKVPASGIRDRSGVQNFTSLYFFPEDIALFMATHKKSRFGFYSVPEVAIRLGIKQEIAYHLVKSGLMTSTIVGSEKKPVFEVTESDISTFQKYFVPLSQLAKTSGTSGRVLKKNFEALGILPVSGPDVDGCIKIFYRKSDLSSHSP